jgi:DNA-binding NarL/FixJ family response regulator
MNPIRVLLVDDQALFREGLRTLLDGRSDLVVVGEAGNGEEALNLAKRLRPHVVLMDLRMPVLDGVAATRQLHASLPECRVLVLTTFDDDELVFAGLRAGAAGYLLKDVSSERLVEAILAIAHGESVLQPSVTAKVVTEFNRMTDRMPRSAESLVELLSEREQQILRLLANGQSNKEIAAALALSEGTVKNHISSILNKLGVRDRTQAALRARELGLI